MNKKTIKLSPEASKAMKKVALQNAELNAAATIAMLPGTIKPACFTLTLGEEVAFEFGPRAFFRMGTLDKPFDITDCSDPKRAYAASVSWLWACLSEPDALSFEDPETLSRVIPLERALECTKALISAIGEYNLSQKQATVAAESVKPKSAA